MLLLNGLPLINMIISSFSVEHGNRNRFGTDSVVVQNTLLYRSTLNSLSPTDGNVSFGAEIVGTFSTVEGTTARIQDSLTRLDGSLSDSCRHRRSKYYCTRS